MSNKKEIKVGNKILVEQAWESEDGSYHDEYAIVKSIGKNGELDLDFFDCRLEIKDFLKGAEFNIKDF